MDEVNEALESDKSIIPVSIIDCKIPFRLKRFHRIDFTYDYEEAFSNLLFALDVKSNNVISKNIKGFINKKLKIFFSYAWADANEQSNKCEKIVNELYESLLKDNYIVKRDLDDKEFSDFIHTIDGAKLVVVAISRHYVKSVQCMFELYEIARNSNFDVNRFRERVLPIIVEFVDLAEPDIIGDYFSFWKNEYNKWNDLVKTHSGQLSVDQMKRYDKIKMIYQNFGKLTEWILYMNKLNPQVMSVDNFAKIKEEIIIAGYANTWK